MELHRYFSNIRIKAIVLGVISLFIFGVISSVIEFYLTGLLPNYSYSIKNPSNANTALDLFIGNNLALFTLISIFTGLIKYVPSGFITAFIAKKAYVLHSIIIGIIASIFLLFSIIGEIELYRSNYLLLLLILNIILAILFCVIGSLIFKNLENRKNEAE